jgi:hypothetical protein
MLAAAAFSLGNAAIGLAGSNADDPESVADYAAEIALSAALIAAAAAFVFLRRCDAGRSRKVGKFGWTVSAGGSALAGIGNFFENGLGASAFGLVFAFGGLALFIGLASAGIAVLASAPPWRWLGVALIVFAAGIAVGEEPGFGLIGLTWIAVAALLAGRAGPFRPDEIAADRA